MCLEYVHAHAYTCEECRSHYGKPDSILANSLTKSTLDLHEMRPQNQWFGPTAAKKQCTPFDLRGSSWLPTLCVPLAISSENH